MGPGIPLPLSPQPWDYKCASLQNAKAVHSLWPDPRASTREWRPKPAIRWPLGSKLAMHTCCWSVFKHTHINLQSQAVRMYFACFVCCCGDVNFRRFVYFYLCECFVLRIIYGHHMHGVSKEVRRGHLIPWELEWWKAVECGESKPRLLLEEPVFFIREPSLQPSDFNFAGANRWMSFHPAKTSSSLAGYHGTDLFSVLWRLRGRLSWAWG